MENTWLKIQIDKLKGSFSFLNFSSKRTNSPIIKITDKTKNVDYSQHIHQHGLSAVDAKVLVESLIDKKFLEFKSDAQSTYLSRTDYFKRKVVSGLENLTEEELNTLKEPDTQFAIQEATLISGKKTNEQLIDTLGSLIIGRIKNHQTQNEDLKNIVFNEAIKTIDKITPNQLKIITLCYILSQTYRKGLKTILEFNEYLKKAIIPFIDFKNTISEFRHIEYAGCGSIGIGQWNLAHSFRVHTMIFQKPFSEKEVTELKLEVKLVDTLFVFSDEHNGLIIPVTHRDNLEDYLKKEGVDENTTKQIMASFDQHLMNDSEIEEKIKMETSYGSKIFEKLSPSEIRNLQLTSVGVAIAATHYENITGEKLNIDLWIN